MSGLPSLRYPAPPRQAGPSEWARDWRKRWFASVGSVHQHYQTGELVAFYSDARDSAPRLALQRELELRRGGVAQVLAVCVEINTERDLRVAKANANGETIRYD